MGPLHSCIFLKVNNAIILGEPYTIIVLIDIQDDTIKRNAIGNILKGMSKYISNASLCVVCCDILNPIIRNNGK